MTTVNQKLADLFSGKIALQPTGSPAPAAQVEPAAPAGAKRMAFSCIFFSDIRRDVSGEDKFRFVRDLVEFADRSGFEAVCFPERHFSEFGSIFASSAVAAAYFAPLTQHVRLRAAAVSIPLHHPAEIAETWAMVDILSNGRVDLGAGSGWNKPDFILSPHTYDDRSRLRDERIPIIQKLWRGEKVEFAGPGGETFLTMVHPRPIQPELNVWYSTFSEHGFQHAGRMGYNMYVMLLPGNMRDLARKIAMYREARAGAGFDPETGVISLLMHTFVHPDADWVQHVVAKPFKQYIATTVVPQMKALDKSFDSAEIEKIVDYSYARYFNTCGLFGAPEDCQKIVDSALEAGVNDIALLMDFGVDYGAVKQSLDYVKQLVDRNKGVRRAG